MNVKAIFEARSSLVCILLFLNSKEKRLKEKYFLTKFLATIKITAGK